MVHKGDIFLIYHRQFEFMRKQLFGALLLLVVVPK